MDMFVVLKGKVHTIAHNYASITDDDTDLEMKLNEANLELDKFILQNSAHIEVFLFLLQNFEEVSLKNDLDSLSEYQLKTLASIISCNDLIVQLNNKRHNPINSKSYITDNLVYKHISSNKKEIKRLLIIFNNLVDKRVAVTGFEEELNNNNLLKTKLEDKDTWLESLKLKVEEFYSLKIITKAERDLIQEKDNYDRAEEEITYSIISIIRIIRNLQFKITDRKDYITFITLSSSLSNYDKSCINILKKSKERYKLILKNAINIVPLFGLKIEKINEEYVFTNLLENEVE